MLNIFKKYWKVLAWICFPFFYLFNEYDSLIPIENFFNIFNKVVVFSIVMLSFIILSNIRYLKSYAVSTIFSFISYILTLYIIMKIIIFINENYISFKITQEYFFYNLLLSIFLILLVLAITLHNNKFIDLTIKDNVHFYINSDQYRTTVHEVGHLICYGLLKKLPPIKVKIIDTKNCFLVREYLGYVEVSDDCEIQKTKSLLEWEMIMLLSGKELERYIMGDSGSGSKGDFKKWQKVAHEYLNLGFGEIYYDKPNNDDERKLNHMTLSKLKRKQEKNLAVFFEYNNKEIKNIIDILYKEKKLSNAQIKNLLDKKIKETSDIKIVE